MNKSMRLLLVTFVMTILTSVTISAQAAVEVSSIPLFVKQSAQPNVMILFDNSGSMETLVEDIIVDVGYKKADVNYYYQICTTVGTSGVNKNNCTAWTNVTYTNIDNAKAASKLCSSGKPVRRIINGSPVSSGAVQCKTLPSSDISNTVTYLDVDANTQTYTYEIEYLYYLLNAYSSGIGSYFGKNSKSRIQIAKNVVVGSSTTAGDGVLDTPNIRFGLAKFNNEQGGKIVAACKGRTAAELTSLKETVDGLAANTWTPLAEAYYEVTRYFRGIGVNSDYNASDIYSDASIYSGGAYVSPMTNYCQKNYVIVVTDGYPTRDVSFPTDDPDDLLDTSRALPNWDNIRTNDPLAGYDCTKVPYKPFSDGYGYQLVTPSESCSDNNGQAKSLYLDDLAEFGYGLDVKSSTAVDSKGRYYVNKDNISTFTVGFAINNQMLKDAGDTYGRGGYYTANSTSELKQALDASMSTIAAKTASGSAVATSSSRLDTDTTIYQALFYSEKWTGRIKAFDVDEVNGKVKISDSPKWTTSNSSFVNHATRKVFTRLNGVGAAFSYATLNAAGALSGLTSEKIDYIRGDQSREESKGGAFRNREDAEGADLIMGDIVNSDPVFVGKNMDFGLDKLTIKDGSVEIGSTYRDFVNTNKENASFKSMLYVGANDGMLHAIEASTGKELFAYVPSTLIPILGELTDPDYKHRFYVDGAPNVAHAYISSRGGWRTILIGSTGYGGISGGTVFALDITDPGSFSASDVLWEYTSPYLGYSAASPSLAPMPNGKFGVMVANGYGSSAEQTAKLIILDVTDGSVVKMLDTLNGTTATSPNGLSQTTLIPGLDRSISTIYAGDLRGNVWKFDVSSSNTSGWDSALKSGGNMIPLFSAVASGTMIGSDSGSAAKTATTVDGKFQPITSGIAVTPHEDGGYMLVFGTGKYFEGFDADGIASGGDYDKDAQVQTAHAVHDNNATSTITYANLQERKFLSRLAGDPTNSFRLDDSAFDITKKGWYLNLGGKDTVASERIVINPVIRQGRAVFLTTIPSGDPCGAGGKSRIFEVMATTGAAPSMSVFDWNEDGVVDALDSNSSGVSEVRGTNADSGLSGDAGLQVGMTIITNGNVEYKLTSGAGGGISAVTESSEGSNPGRASWRQIK